PALGSLVLVPRQQPGGVNVECWALLQRPAARLPPLEPSNDRPSRPAPRVLVQPQQRQASGGAPFEASRPRQLSPQQRTGRAAAPPASGRPPRAAAQARRWQAQLRPS